MRTTKRKLIIGTAKVANIIHMSKSYSPAKKQTDDKRIIVSPFLVSSHIAALNMKKGSLLHSLGFIHKMFCSTDELVVNTTEHILGCVVNQHIRIELFILQRLPVNVE